MTEFPLTKEALESLEQMGLPDLSVCENRNFALYEAGLRERKHPKPQKLGRKALVAKGYKECAQPGCTVLVAPSRRYCRKRSCQDARWRDAREVAA